MSTYTTSSSEFDLEVSTRSLGRNLPQRVGRVLALPMLAMALMAFPAAFIVGAVRADKISDAGDPSTIAALQHVTAGLMFIGFAAVFAGISFAIARILGELRKGGGDVQEASGRTVKTLRMPLTAKVFLGGMMMAMMTLLAAVVIHFAFAVDVDDSASSLADSEERFIVLEAVRRVGVAMYLASIVLGLAAITQVLRFQSIRIRELVSEARRS